MSLNGNGMETEWQQQPGYHMIDVRTQGDRLCVYLFEKNGKITT